MPLRGLTVGDKSRQFHSMNIDREIKSHCNSCGMETNHFILFCKEERKHTPDDRFGWTDTYMVLECCGCRRISMRQDYETPDRRGDDGNDLHEIYYYPPAIFRRFPNWDHGGLINKVDFEYRLKGRLLQEIYVCLQNKCERAAVMLIRALLEHIFYRKGWR